MSERPQRVRKFTLEMNGFGGVNTSSSVEEHKHQVVRRNAPPYVLHNFFRSKSAQLIYQMRNGTEVALQEASNPYGVDLQVVALPDYVQKWEREEMKAIQMTDLAREDRYKIVEVLNAYLATVTKLPPPDRIGRNRIGDIVKSYKKRKENSATIKMITENRQYLSYIDSNLRNTPHEVDTLTPRTPRSIFATHFHGPVIMQNWLKEHRWEIDHVDRQDELVTKLMQSPYGLQFLQNLKQGMLDASESQQARAYIKNNLRIDPVTEHKEDSAFHPTGYTLRLPQVNAKNLTNPTTTALVADLLYAHDVAYIKEIGELQKTLQHAKDDGKEVPFDPKEWSAPQPSFSRYMQLVPTEHGQQFAMTIAPTICSFGGPIEVGGIQLLRDPHRPFPISKKLIDRYHKRIVKRVKKITASDTTGEKGRVDNMPKWYRRGKRKYNEVDLP